MKAVVGRLLRNAADLIDREHGPRAMWLSFTFRKGTGLVLHEDGTGCHLWYMAEDYDKAWENYQ